MTRVPQAGETVAVKVAGRITAQGQFIRTDENGYTEINVGNSVRRGTLVNATSEKADQ